MGLWGPPEPHLYGSPQSQSRWGDGDPLILIPMGPWGPPEFCPYGTTGTPNAWSLRRPPIPMGSRGPPEPPFHGDPPNLIPTGPWGPPEPPLLQQQGLCVLSPWTAGHRPYQAQGTPCPHTDGLGVPVGFPLCGGTLPAHPAGRGLHPCSPYLLRPGGSAGRDTGTRGDGATSVPGVQTRPAPTFAP